MWARAPNKISTQFAYNCSEPPTTKEFSGGFFNSPSLNRVPQNLKNFVGDNRRGGPLEVVG